MPIPRRRVRALREPAELPSTARAPRRLVVLGLCGHPVEIGVDPRASHRSQSERIALATSRKCPRCRELAISRLFDDSPKPPASITTTAKTAAVPGTLSWPFFHLVKSTGVRVTMWRNPKYPGPPPPTPPADDAERLATFPRGDGRELRISMAEYQGHPYISLRVWMTGQDGQMWPVKGKGCSVRLREVPELLAALGGLVRVRPEKKVEGSQPFSPPAENPFPRNGFQRPAAGLPDLVGTRAQCHWAESIRRRLIVDAERAGDRRTLGMLRQVIDSTWFIANRGGLAAGLKPPAPHQLAGTARERA
jgi:hypothetical protein